MDDYLANVEYTADPNDMWGLRKSLSGSPDSVAPNEALVVEGRVITTNPKKADCFAGHYARVSKLSFSKEERDRNRELKKKMKTNSVDAESCKDFDMVELEGALKAMKSKGAPGKDDVPPSFLKNLGPRGKQELLAILNESLHQYRPGNLETRHHHTTPQGG